MPLTSRSSRYRLGFAKQSAEGSGIATATHEVSLYQGSIEPVNVRALPNRPKSVWVSSPAAPCR